MSKLTIILCVAIFASAANAGFITDQLEKAQESLHNLIESTIAKVKYTVADAKRKAEELSARIEAQINEYKKKIADDVESQVEKAVANINELTNSIKGADASDCAKMVDHLQATAHTAILQMRKCFIDKHMMAVQYVENIIKAADKVLASLHNHKLDARACISNVDGFISAGKALVCTNLVAAKAGWTTVKAAPAISVEGAKLTFLLTTLPSSLSLCTATNALNTFHHEVSSIAGNTASCVRQRIQEVREGKTTPQILPENPATDASTSPPKSTATEILPESPVTEESISSPASTAAESSPESPATEEPASKPDADIPEDISKPDPADIPHASPQPEGTSPPASEEEPKITEASDADV